MRPINRIQPAGPPEAYKTYSVLAPPTTHFRPATCEEAECLAHANGWRTVVDERLELGQRQAHYIRAESRRKYAEHRGEDGLTVFTFEAGQTCFTRHQARLDRPEVFTVRGGDWRGSGGLGSYTHVRAEDWVEDFALHQQQITDRIERG